MQNSWISKNRIHSLCLFVSLFWVTNVMAVPTKDWHKLPPMPRYKAKPFSNKPTSGKQSKQKSVHSSNRYKLLPAVQWKHIRRAGKQRLWEKDRELGRKIQRYYGRNGREARVLIETDKPLYKPGEVVWFRVVAIQHKGNLPSINSALKCELLSPRGQVLQKGMVKITKGHAHFQFFIQKHWRGGEYTVRVRDYLTGDTTTKKIVVSVYQAPRIKKKLEFLRKGYGAGDEVQATLSLYRATGAPLANHPIRLVASLSGRIFRRWTHKTNAKGEALLQFTLPKKLKTDDGLLNVLVTEAGVTESIARPIPLANRNIKVGFFPEGGHEKTVH